jgi:hypothetical protein
MDLNSLNRDAPISVLTIFFFIIAGLALFGMIFGRTIALKKFKKQTPPGSIFVLSFGLLAVTSVLGFGSIVNDQYEVLNNSFHEKLAAGYGFHTESTEYAVERAAADERSITVTDDSGATVRIQPYRNGDTLTFYKVDRGEPITPRK